MRAVLFRRLCKFLQTLPFFLSISFFLVSFPFRLWQIFTRFPFWEALPVLIAVSFFSCCFVQFGVFFVFPVLFPCVFFLRAVFRATDRIFPRKIVAKVERLKNLSLSPPPFSSKDPDVHPLPQSFLFLQRLFPGGLEIRDSLQASSLPLREVLIFFFHFFFFYFFFHLV